MKNKYKKQAKELIQWFREGSDLTDEQEHVLYDAAAEHCQILENVIHMTWFESALAENLEALEVNK